MLNGLELETPQYSVMYTGPRHACSGVFLQTNLGFVGFHIFKKSIKRNIDLVVSLPSTLYARCITHAPVRLVYILNKSLSE